jgi:hypothetical protein
MKTAKKSVKSKNLSVDTKKPKKIILYPEDSLEGMKINAIERIKNSKNFILISFDNDFEKFRCITYASKTIDAIDALKLYINYLMKEC